MNDARTAAELATEIIDEMTFSGIETHDDQLKAVTADRFEADRTVRALRAQIDELRSELENEVRYLDALIILEHRLWDERS